ncbi:MAG: fructosamine kinase family protein [Clostridia bacterium]|nr:fructosamine kinase family protein [Clostridia bacterium]
MQLLLNGTYNALIEAVTSKYLGRPFRVRRIVKNEVSSMHAAARFCGDGFDVFVKKGYKPYSLDMMTQEALCLDYVRQNSMIKTPEVIGVLQADDGSVLLVLQAIDTVRPETDADWETLGRGLALLHQTEGARCGFHTHTYLGVFRQDNTFEDSWEEFFGVRRLFDTMKMAVDVGNMETAQCAKIERLVQRLPQLCGPKQPFSLLHGDPWPGNLLFDGKQMIAIDCGIYYGNREIDLSTVDFFYPVTQRFFDAYHETYPIDPGYAERKQLWQINQWLGHVTLYGGKYMGRLMQAVEKYL